MDNTLFEKMENDVLQLILREQPFLLDQLKNAIVAKREFTGVGFYSHFHIDNAIDGDDMQISDVGGKINNSIHVGFVLFIEKGKLNFLEGYTYNEPWPEIIENYELFFE